MINIYSIYLTDTEPSDYLRVGSVPTLDDAKEIIEEINLPQDSPLKLIIVKSVVNASVTSLTLRWLLRQGKTLEEIIVKEKKNVIERVIKRGLKGELPL